MKRCPECRRDYHDDSLMYCLEDGAPLVQGTVHSPDDISTAVLHRASGVSESSTRIFPGGRPPAAASQLLHASRKPVSKRVVVIPLVLLVVAFAGYLIYRGLRSSPHIDSIAVLPLANESGNPDLDYLSDGLTESLIKNLSQIEQLKVKPRSTVFRYKGRGADPHGVGRELQVLAVLNGRVVQRGQDLALFVELIDIASDQVVWSEQYNRRISDLVSLENEIARDVSGKIRTRLSGVDEQKLSKTYTSNPEAYQLYLRGRHEWNKFSLEGLRASISYFERAIQIDPNYAVAYSGLADSYVNLGIDFISPRDTMPKAKVAALQAIALDDSLAEAHSSLGSYKLFYEWDTAGAEAQYRKAIGLDPSYATAHHFYSHCLQFAGREADAFHEIKTAIELEPLSALNNAELAWAYYLARQYEASIEQARKTIDLEPGFAYAYFVMGMVYNARGQSKDALLTLEKASALAPDWLELQGEIAYTHASAGDHRRAQEMLTKVIEASAGGYVNEVIVASVYAALGDNDKAMTWLERGFQGRCSWMKWISIEPKLDKLHSDSRFQELVRRIGS